MTGFGVNQNKGFHITFENGVTISVQFGYGNYCENREKQELSNAQRFKFTKSVNAEVGIWDKDSRWITKHCKALGTKGDVAGWLRPSTVAKAITWASRVDPSKIKDGKN